MKDLHIWNFIHSNISKNKNVIFSFVVNHEKGSPGKTGFKMAVSSDGSVIGSIGGGVMEYKLLNEFKSLFRNKSKVDYIEKLIHYKRKNISEEKLKSSESGLICSGTQTIAVKLLTKKNLPVIKNILKSISDNIPAKLILSEDKIKLNPVKNTFGNKYNIEFFNNSKWVYEELINVKYTVLIIGGGHVGVALSKIMNDLDFYVIILDNRKEVSTLKNNIYADRIITDSYRHCLKYIKDINRTFAVVVTSGFVTDKEALKELLKKDLKYTGLMGTKAKIKKIYNELIKDGIKRETLNKIHAPVGIDINSDTPEEISISIAAEIIKIKNN